MEVSSSLFPLHSPSSQTVLKTASFQGQSPECNSQKQYAQYSNPFKISDTPFQEKEEIIKLDLFININAVNLSQVQIEKINDEKVIFFQDHKVEYWYFIVNGNVKLSYTPLKFPLASSELQELIQSYDYLKIRDCSQLGFTFCKDETQPNKNPPSTKQISEIQNQSKEHEEPEPEILSQRQSKKKIEVKTKKEHHQKEQQNFIVRHMVGGDIISFKEQKYYSTTGICSKGSTVVKIGLQQIQNLKIYQLWYNYLHEHEQHSFGNDDCNKNQYASFEDRFSKNIQKFKFIKSTPLFQHITTDFIDQSFNLVYYKQGQCIYKQLDIPQFIYILKDGELELLKQTQNSVNSPTMSRSPSISPRKNTSSPLRQNPYLKASILSTGSIFGEEEIITSSLRIFTARVCSKQLAFFLDCLCRQNEGLLDKLKQKRINSQSWRDSQIDSIQKVQKRLNQIENQSKSNKELLNNSFMNESRLQSQEINPTKLNTDILITSLQNSPVKQKVRAQSHMRMNIIPAIKSLKTSENQIFLPQLINSSHNQEEKKPTIKQNDLEISINEGVKSKCRNGKDGNRQKGSMDQEESRIKSQVKNKQNILNLIKKNNSFLVSNRFPSFEKPLIPISNGLGLGVFTKNKYLISSNRQSRNPSQPSLEYNRSSENLNDDSMSSRIKNKLYLNTSFVNLTVNSQNQNRNFEELISDIDIDVQKDQIRISSLINPLQKQLAQMQKQHPINLVNNNSKSRNMSMNSISQLNKEQNRSMDDIYAQLQKPNHNSKLINANADQNRINSFRNPYLDEQNSLRNSFVELSPTQIGSEIDKNLRISSQQGQYFRPSRNYLLNKAEFKERIPKHKHFQKISSQQDNSNNSTLQDQTDATKDIKNIYNSLEKYRLLEKNTTKEYSKKKQEGYNKEIRDKIENYLNGQIESLPTNFRIIKDAFQSNNFQPTPLSLSVVSRLSPQNTQRAQKNELAKKLLDYSQPNINNDQPNINNVQLNMNNNQLNMNNNQLNVNNDQPNCNNGQTNMNVFIGNGRKRNELKSGRQSIDQTTKQNTKKQSSGQHSIACDCRYCLPHYKQQSSNSMHRYQLQEGGCSMQYTNKKNQILKKATSIIYGTNYPDSVLRK